MAANPSIAEQIRLAQAVQDKYSDALLSMPHVVGVAIGFSAGTHHASDPEEKRVCLVVMVDACVDPETQPEDERIPEILDGVPVEVQVTGQFSAGTASE